MWAMHRSPEGLCIAVVLSLATVLSSGVARAISVLDVDRSILIRAVYVDANLNEYTVTTSRSNQGYGYWSDSLSGGAVLYPVTASQASSIVLSPAPPTHAELSGTGTVSMQHTSEYAESIYHVRLTLDAVTEYAFAVDNLSPGQMFQVSTAGGFVRLDRVDPLNPDVVLESIESVTLCRIYLTGAGCPDFSAAGLLQPGTYAFDYQLRVLGSHFSNLPATAGFSVTLDEVPEPGTLVLFAGGLAGLAAIWRRAHGRGAATAAPSV